MSQAERGWADPRALEIDHDRERLRYLVDKRLRRDELLRQVEIPSERELAAEEAQLP